LKLGIDELDKMMKLYHNTLSDPGSSADDSIMAIFQRASNDFGCTLEQGVLLKKQRPVE
jgi:hypothetical protein